MMIMVEAASVRLSTSLYVEAQDFFVNYELKKEELYHQIKIACIKGKYDTTFSMELTEAEKAMLESVLKGFGYEYAFNDDGTIYVSWA